MPAELLERHHCPAVNIRTHTQNCNHFRKFVVLVFLYYLLRRTPDPTLCAQYANGKRRSWCDYTRMQSQQRNQKRERHEMIRQIAVMRD